MSVHSSCGSDCDPPPPRFVTRLMNTYNTGDAVWCLDERRTEGVCPKLQPAFIGPWVIVERINDQLFSAARQRWATSHYNAP